MISFPSTINLTFLYCWRYNLSSRCYCNYTKKFSLSVPGETLTVHLGKFDTAWSLYVSFPCLFEQCFKGFCWFVYRVSNHLFTYDTFIHFAALARRLTVTFFISLTRKEIFKHSFQVLFLVCKEIHNSNKKLITFNSLYKAHFFNTSFRKWNSS